VVLAVTGVTAAVVGLVRHTRSSSSPAPALLRAPGPNPGDDWSGYQGPPTTPGPHYDSSGSVTGNKDPRASSSSSSSTPPAMGATFDWHKYAGQGQGSTGTGDATASTTTPGTGAQGQSGDWSR
jgi:hypothetical protein